MTEHWDAIERLARRPLAVAFASFLAAGLTAVQPAWSQMQTGAPPAAKMPAAPDNAGPGQVGQGPQIQRMPQQGAAPNQIRQIPGRIPAAGVPKARGAKAVARMPGRWYPPKNSHLGRIILPRVVENQRVRVPDPNLPSSALEIFPLTQEDNPVLTAACRSAAYQVSKNNINYQGLNWEQKLNRVGKMWGKYINWERSGQAGKAPEMIPTYKMVVSEFQRCSICGPIVNELLNCHIKGVKVRPRTIVFFGPGKTKLDSTERDKLRAFVKKHKVRNLLIEARASILSKDEKVKLNERLARQRGESVRSLLLQEANPAPYKVVMKNIVWTPPRLDDKFILGQYGFSGLWGSLPRKEYLNQSVVVTAF